LDRIGLPYYDSQLLSSWTPQFVSGDLNFPPPAKIPPHILADMKVNDNIAYATYPKELKGRRNVVTVGNNKNNARFISGMSSVDDVSSLQRYNSFVKFKFSCWQDATTPTFEYAVHGVPRAYRQVEIEYSKFGVSDFDFGLARSISFDFVNSLPGSLDSTTRRNIAVWKRISLTHTPTLYFK
jgi:PAB-dependent poly(A)-specific ribonuclease subunit 2